MKTSNRTLAKIIMAVMAVTVTFGCAKKEEEAPSLGSGGLTASQLAGTRYSSCTAITSDTTFGAALNGTSYMQGLTFTEEGTYMISTFWFTGATCQMGGSQILNYSQAGTFKTGGIMDSPSGATQVLMTAVASQLTTYGGTAGDSRTWATNFNNCAGGPGFSTSANDTKSVSGWHCFSINPDFSFPTFTPIGSVSYNAVTLDTSSAKTSITSFHQASSIWDAGQAGSYPTTSNTTFTEP